MPVILSYLHRIPFSLFIKIMADLKLPYLISTPNTKVALRRGEKPGTRAVAPPQLAVGASHRVVTKVKDHQIVVGSEFAGVSMEHELDLFLGLELKDELNATTSDRLVEYGTEVFLDFILSS